LQNFNSSSVSTIQSSLPKSAENEQHPSDQQNQIKQEIEALNQQNQLLFNQYMHLNMQFLSQKLESLEKAPE